MLKHSNIILKKNGHWISNRVCNEHIVAYEGNGDLWPHESGLETSTIGYPVYVKAWATFNRRPGGFNTLYAHDCKITPRVTLTNRTIDISQTIQWVSSSYIISNNSELEPGGSSLSNVIEFALDWDAIQALLSDSNRLPLNIGYVAQNMEPGAGDYVYGDIYTSTYYLHD